MEPQNHPHPTTPCSQLREPGPPHPPPPPHPPLSLLLTHGGPDARGRLGIHRRPGAHWAACSHDTAFCFCWHNVCPVLPPQSLNPSRSAEAEIALNEKGPGFICFLLQPLSPPVYRHAVTSDNNAQRQQMLMSFLCSPHNKSIKTTSENYEPP